LYELKIDEKTYWEVEKDKPSGRQIPIVSDDSDTMEILPSDWRYREDLIWLKYGYELIAH